MAARSAHHYNLLPFALALNDVLEAKPAVLHLVHDSLRTNMQVWLGF